MKYTLHWKESAEEELLRLWLGARDRSRLNEASTMIDKALSTQPAEAGESREPGYRVLIVDPLAVYFEIDELRREVWVANVWRVR